MNLYVAIEKYSSLADAASRINKLNRMKLKENQEYVNGAFTVARLNKIEFFVVGKKKEKEEPISKEELIKAESRKVRKDRLIPLIVKLKEMGYTFEEISKLLPVPESTATYWYRDFKNEQLGAGIEIEC